MSDASGAIAIVGVSAILPDAPDADAFWQNVTEGHYCISEVDRDRWDPDLHFDPDPKVPEHTYSKIGGWVRDWEWDPLAWKLPIPPKVSDAMDDAQKWGLACTRMALLDYGWPERPLDFERTAVVFGNAMSGEHHYLTALRLAYPELARELSKAPSYAGLPESEREAIARELRSNMEGWLPPVTEDTMPGELGNCLAGRVANLFNLRGPNFVVDAACASALAAMDASIEGLIEREFDAVITGGIDRNMGASTFIKFCAIGALSASGTRPYAEGADGFVMGEGAALFVLKRLEDAERDGDRIYAVVRGVAGSSDGKGKGITAPNPIGQKLAVERAWRKSGLSPEVCSLVEGHGTSTAVGDVVEVESLSEAFSGAQLEPHSVALGSVKSNIGHLKGAAGAAGLLKATLSLHHKVLPPSLNFERPNPNVDWSSSPFAVNTELREWETHDHEPRVAAVSAFGFGGTNFHAVLEEHVPGRLTGDGAASISVPAELKPANVRAAAAPPPRANGGGREPESPLRGALVLGAPDEAALAGRLTAALEDARAGRAPAPAPPEAEALRSAERIAIDYADADELAAKAELALKALQSGNVAAWQALRARGIFRGAGPPPKVAFLYTGQGSQYANMLARLREKVPLVAEAFQEAGEVMRPLLDGRNLSDVIFVDPDDPKAMAQAEADLMHTEITQPAVLTVDIALTRLLDSYGISPDFVMGHSLGEYGALVTAGVLPFDQALEAVSARGHEMASLEVDDPGAMAAVMAPSEIVEEVVDATDGYVVLANVNSQNQVVLGGASEAVAHAVAAFQERGHTAIPLPVSHAFHTEIVAPASEPLRTMLRRLHISPPGIPIVANVDGEFYPTGDDAEERITDILGRQVASPVQFVKGLHTLFDAGARVFVETGPKRALHGFASDVLGEEEALNLYTNHPKLGDLVSFNHALCGLYSAGLGVGRESEATAAVRPSPPIAQAERSGPPAESQQSDDVYRQLGRLSAEFLRRGSELLGGDGRPPEGPAEPVVITGAALGLPGTQRVFDDHNVARILHGEQFIDVIPSGVRHDILDRHITRLVKGDDGSAKFEAIDDVADVIKLAARAGELDLAEEFGIDPDRVAALGRSTQLAIGAGIDALRDAGIPLVLHYKTTTKGTQLPDRWQLPPDLRDDTAVIFASAFPGLEEFAREAERFSADRSRRERLAELEALRERLEGHGDSQALTEVDRHIHDLRVELEEKPYQFDRRFLFRVLSMGHSQLAELIGARGPNTQVNAACASTTQAVAIAEDWIRAGRCRRAIIVAADDATSDELLPWIGAGFLASGAAATDEVVEEAALPFDQRRHGMLIGMGAAALVVEGAKAARERGITPICEVLSASSANSAFHGTRLDVDHIGEVMEQVVARAESSGVDRRRMSEELVFVSHETYTPARGGSAAAEIHALRRVFGDGADQVLIANTKGVTGHPMGVGLEDVVAIKSLETGIVPPVPNFRDVDPELGELNLSKGGAYPVSYALRLAAGFGSQISMMLLHWTPVRDGQRRAPEELGYSYRIGDPDRWIEWLRAVSAQESPELEVVQRRLRVVDRGPAAAPTAPAGEPPVAVPLGAPETEIADREVEPRIVPSPATEGITEAPAEAPQTPEAETAPAEPPAPQPAAAPRPAPAEAPSAGEDPTERILALVSEQTGYPSDLLDLDLDLEADLGIDTVKQAEVFAAIREAYGIPFDDTLKLRDYPTLNHVVAFVRERAGGVEGEPETADQRAPAEQAAGEEPKRFPRRVPVPVVRPALEHCVPTGVSLEADSRVLVMRDTGGVAGALEKKLRKLGVDVLTADPQGEDIEGKIEAWTADGPVQGAFWLPALDAEPPPAELDFEAWADGLRIRVKLLARAMRQLAEQIDGEGTFLVAGTRLGGWHGYDAAGATSAMGGAVTGFVKSLARERPDALVKAVDFPPSRKTAALADILIDETLSDPGAVEVGHADGLRWSVGLVERPVEPDPDRALGAETVFCVTGAAGSIVSAITTDLAAASGGTFHLLDLVGEPDPADPDLSRFASDRDGLKRELAERIKERGERPTPKLVERELARIERGRAALDALEAIREAGGKAYWHQVDLTDPDQVSAAVKDVLRDSGRVDALIHCAGLEVSHFLPDKPQSEFDLVFDVKVSGWFNLLNALGDTAVGAAVVFSSIAGRFGNGGQTDYAAANDLLCKSISRLRGEGVRGVAIDWTAWAEIGMATRGSIPKVMEMAGIDMLPPREGVPVVRRELTAAGPGAEVLVAGALGVLAEERHSTGGLDPEAATEAIHDHHGPMTGRVAGFSSSDGFKVLTELDPTHQAFLDHHRIEGTPVLPGVMGIEAFAEAAAAMLPGWQVTALEDVELSAPFKFYRDEPRALELQVLHRGGSGDTLVADCRLVGTRSLPQGEQRTIHFTGRAVLARELPQPPKEEDTPGEAGGDGGVGPDSIYQIYFHGPAYRVLERAWRHNGEVLGRLAADLPPDHEPAGEPLVAAPRLIELCFQTAGVWELGTRGRLALPTHVDRVIRYSDADAPGKLVAVARPREDGSAIDARVVDEQGRVRVLLQGYRTIELPGAPDAEALEPIRSAMS